MTIDLLTNLAGASKYGTCVECNKDSNQDPAMKRLRFNNQSICLCKECLTRIHRQIDKMEEEN